MDGKAAFFVTTREFVGNVDRSNFRNFASNFNIDGNGEECYNRIIKIGT